MNFWQIDFLFQSQLVQRECFVTLATKREFSWKYAKGFRKAVY